MATISIIGNGFDIRHNMKTTYKEFFKSLDYASFKTNILYCYLRTLGDLTSWIDFENGLLKFLEVYSKLSNTITCYNSDGYKPIIDRQMFVTDMDSYLFYEVLIKMKYEIFDNLGSGQHMVTSDAWVFELNQIITNDYNDLKKSLISYLYDQETPIANIHYFGDKVWQILSKSKDIFNFNYTNTIEKYSALSGKTKYVHGSLHTNIVLGIPYSESVQKAGFGHLFKTTQRIQFQDIYSNYILDDYHLELVFIGFSFGQSDHYFFQSIRDAIKISEPKISDYLKFVFFYHDEDAKASLINNLRIFMGDDNLVRYHSRGKIAFETYT